MLLCVQTFCQYYSIAVLDQWNRINLECMGTCSAVQYIVRTVHALTVTTSVDNTDYHFSAYLAFPNTQAVVSISL